MKNSNDTIGSRTRNLPAFSAVTQPTAPPRAPILLHLPFRIPNQVMFFMFTRGFTATDSYFLFMQYGIIIYAVCINVLYPSIPEIYILCC